MIQPHPQMIVWCYFVTSTLNGIIDILNGDVVDMLDSTNEENIEIVTEPHVPKLFGLFGIFNLLLIFWYWGVLLLILYSWNENLFYEIDPYTHFITSWIVAQI